MPLETAKNRPRIFWEAIHGLSKEQGMPCRISEFLILNQGFLCWNSWDLVFATRAACSWLSH